MLVTAATSGGAGAVGDGVTNDQAAIQRAIATAQLTGDVVEFPVTHNAVTGVPEAPFKYLVGDGITSTPLFVGNEKKLTLKGPGQIIIAAGQEGIIVNDGVGQSEDILFDGLNITGGTSPIVSRGPHRFRIQNCVIEGFTLYGVYVDSSGVPHNTIIQDCNIYSADGSTATGIQIESVDTVAKGNVIRGCTVGIYSNSPACKIIGNHIFPDTDTDGSTARTTNYSIQLGSSADHLVNIADNYLDNAKLAFVAIDESGSTDFNSSRAPKDYNEMGTDIRIRGNFMLTKDHPTTVKQVIGGPANWFDNLRRDNS